MKTEYLVKFEEKYVDNEYETTTYYFIIHKALLDFLCPDKYPEADHGEISIEFPTNYPEANMATVQISPIKDGYDYDWSDLNLPYEIIEKLMSLALNSNLD